MDKAKVLGILNDANLTDADKVAKAIEALSAVGVGNVHLLAQIFGVAKLTEIAVGATLPFADLYMKYNDLRPKGAKEEVGAFKSLPQQMWREQGIGFKLSKSTEGVATFTFTGYDEAKHLAFRAKNKAQKDKKKAEASDDAPKADDKPARADAGTVVKPKAKAA